MKIDERVISYENIRQFSKNTPDVAGGVETGQTPGDQKKTGGGVRPEHDTIVNLSQASKEARLAEEAVAASPDVRADKVESIKAKIEAGTYRVDQQAVADKMVDAFLDEIF